MLYSKQLKMTVKAALNTSFVKGRDMMHPNISVKLIFNPNTNRWPYIAYQISLKLLLKLYCLSKFIFCPPSCAVNLDSHVSNKVFYYVHCLNLSSKKKKK